MADPGWTFTDPPATPSPSPDSPAPGGWSFTDTEAAALPHSYQGLRRTAAELTAKGNADWNNGFWSKPLAAFELLGGGALRQLSADPVTPAATDLGAAAIQPFKELPANYRKMQADAIQLLQKGNEEWGKHTFWAKPLAAWHLLGGGMAWAMSPIDATIKTFLGDPFERTTGIPGSSDFVSNAAQAASSFTPTAKIVDALGLFGDTKVADSVLKTLSPTARKTVLEKAAIEKHLDFFRPGAEVTEESIRAMTSYIARDTAMADAELGKFRKLVGGLSFEARVDFIDAIETGVAQTDPALQPMADFLRKILDDRRARIQGLGKGYLDTFIENYFPHIWKDPTRAAEVFRDQKVLESRRPLKGSGSFLKQRSIDTVKAGLEQGLELATDNPLDLVAIKLREMDRFYYGHKMIEEMKANGHLRFVRAGDRVPLGWARLDDPAFKVFVRNDPEVIADMKAVAEAHGVDVSGAPVPGVFAKLGEWYAPETSATLLNNYLSKGLAATSVGDIGKFVREFGNTLNALQLSFSGFHLIFTTNDAIISRMALALKQAARGEVVRAVGTAVTAPIAPLRNLWFGSKLRRAYLNPGDATPEMQRIVEAAVEGGARIGQDQYWRTIGTRPIIASIRDGTFLRDTIEELKGTRLAAPFKLARKMLQDLSAPIMEVWVPRQKLGVFYDMAQDYLRRNPHATTLELRGAMKKAWDSVDNRLGEMVYDNVFWSKTAKDISHLLVRSVGWDLGTIREIGGAFVDATGNLRTLAGLSRKELELTHRMAYTIAMPAVIALEGAALTYLYTGKGPQEALDYFYPPTGQTLPNGQKQRVSIPSYMKDVVATKVDPIGTAENKAAPWIASTTEMLQNKDFYGGFITDPDAPAAQQALDYAMFFATQVTPFTVQGQQRLRQSGATPLESTMSFLGFQPPPGYITDPGGTLRRYERQLMQERRKKAREKYAAARGAAAAEAAGGNPATAPTPPSGGEGWKF